MVNRSAKLEDAHHRRHEAELHAKWHSQAKLQLLRAERPAQVVHHEQRGLLYFLIKLNI